MKKKLLLITLLICFSGILSGQNPFFGSFVMSFKVAESTRDEPLLWIIEPVADGGKMALEIQDEMKNKGVSKRVLFNPADSTWTMMIEFNKIKQGSRIHAAMMYHDTVKRNELKRKITKERRNIGGYRCKKIIIESEKFIADVWVTDQVKFDLCNVYRLLSHCGMMSEFVRKGDWYFSKNLNEMIMEVTSIKKSTGELYTMSILMMKPGDTNESFFTTDGFKIADIPEGLNCGVVME